MTRGNDETTEAGQWVGWFKGRARGSQWRRVCQATSPCEAWQLLLDRLPDLGSGESMVLAAGQHPRQGS